MINRPVALVGLSQLLPYLNLSLKYRESIQKFRNIPFSSSWTAMTRTFHVEVVGCTRPLSILRNMESCSEDNILTVMLIIRLDVHKLTNSISKIPIW